MDCRNFAPIDVVKGICHLSKERVQADDASCPSFDRLPRCGECERYSPSDQQDVGVCRATPDHPMTYPGLAAVTCEWFRWRGR
ncbi:MAG: 4-hydroxyphenylacetate decarboxylase small subunit [Candidatus Bipolaricaulota bacterium]|nr:MAG: 4-hydroxyphenylacetate decarboxylase small subunit [Candidatus Bipolaricaulota bacterium]